jgi:hypothetical protein
MLKASDPRFNEVVEYLEEITLAANLNGTFRRDGDEVVIA